MSAPPGPTSQPGAAGEICSRPFCTRNQPPTRPPCRPIAPHREPESARRCRASTRPNRIRPPSSPKASSPGARYQGCSRAKISACTTSARRAPSWSSSSPHSQPRNSSSSANPTPASSSRPLSSRAPLSSPSHWAWPAITKPAATRASKSSAFSSPRTPLRRARAPGTANPRRSQGLGSCQTRLSLKGRLVSNKIRATTRPARSTWSERQLGARRARGRATSQPIR